MLVRNLRKALARSPESRLLTFRCNLRSTVGCRVRLGGDARLPHSNLSLVKPPWFSSRANNPASKTPALRADLIHGRCANLHHDSRRANPKRLSPTRRRSGRQLPLVFPTRFGHRSFFPVTVTSSARTAGPGWGAVQHCSSLLSSSRLHRGANPGARTRAVTALPRRVAPGWRDAVQAFAWRTPLGLPSDFLLAARSQS